MPIYRPPTADNVNEWLAMATRDLAPSVKARIRAEIESHFADALAAHKENGLDDPAAHAAALADLGNPWVAKKRFRRQHLTVKEAERLERLNDVGSHPRWGFILVIVIPGMLQMMGMTDELRTSEYYSAWFGGILVLAITLAALVWASILANQMPAGLAKMTQTIRLNTLWFSLNFPYAWLLDFSAFAYRTSTIATVLSLLAQSLAFWFIVIGLYWFYMQSKLKKWRAENESAVAPPARDILPS